MFSVRVNPGESVWRKLWCSLPSDVRWRLLALHGGDVQAVTLGEIVREVRP